AELSVFMHEVLTDKRLGGLFDAAQQESLNDVEQANLSEMQRAWQQATILPASLVEAKSLAGSRCEHAWRQQRPANDWQGFSANLKEVVKLSREEAQLRAEALGVSRYDALLDVFEPGMTSAQLDNTFGELKSWLPALLQKAVEKQQKTAIAAPVGPFAVEAQKQLGLSVMKTLGFDFNHGRLDVSAHPFCGGVPEDVRITTRYNESD
ncbi:carboxypeptidase M32, partial [Serratia bockelmannii]|nr:carboxypeptidase M32 [Serratia bockelmannii]